MSGENVDQSGDENEYEEETGEEEEEEYEEVEEEAEFQGEEEMYGEDGPSRRSSKWSAATSDVTSADSSRVSVKGSRKSKRNKKKKKTDGREDEIQLPPECCETCKEEEEAAARNLNPTKNKMSIPWFKELKLTPELSELASFSESLLMVDEMGNSAGKMFASIKSTQFGDSPCLSVHSGSYGTPCPGVECGTSITGFISNNLTTLQELVHEWAHCDGKLTERKIFISNEPTGMHVQITQTVDGKVEEDTTSTLTKAQRRLLVTESLNILLLRLIMLDQRADGDMELRTLTFEGKVVPCKYKVLNDGWEIVRGDQIRTWSIRRTVLFDFGDKIWESMLTAHGRLILRFQPDNMHALIPLWFEPVRNKDGEVISYPPYVWACDAELYSKYLMKKEEFNRDYRCYLLQHPELKALLSDFIQAVLLRKPGNIIPFAQQYFESFLKLKAEVSSSGGLASNLSSSSSSSSSESLMYGEGGEWYPEYAGDSDDDDEDKGQFDESLYPIKPKRSLDGLEMSYQDDSTTQRRDEDETDAVTVANGEYVKKS